MQIYAFALAGTVLLAGLGQYFAKVTAATQTRPRKIGLFAWLLIILLASISALRYGVGTDYWTYYRLFPQYVEDLNEGVTPWEEPGIRVISWTVSELGGDAFGMIAVCAAITVGLNIRTIWKWSPALTFSAAIYILSGTWYGSFNGVRQHVAAAILFAGHRHVVNRHPIRWILVVLVASLFHTSASVGLLIYLVPRRRIDFKGHLLIIFLAIGLLFATSELLQIIDNVHRLGSVSESGTALRRVNPLRVLFAFLPVLLIWLLPKPKIIDEDNAWFYVNMLVVFAAGMLATSSSVLLTRFIMYPDLFVGIGIAYITSYSNKKDRLAVRSILLPLYAIFMYVEISNNSDLNNFQWIFEALV